MGDNYMSNDMECFFKTLENPNYLAMKMLLDVFNRMEIADDSSRKIIDNISAFSDYHIRFIDSGTLSNYVFSEDDLSNIDFAISGMGNEYSTCHEFGHLLLDIFAKGELPENYSEVNALCVKRLMEREDDVENMLQGFTFHVFQKLTEGINKPIEFLDRYPEFVTEYLKKYPEKNRIELLQDAISDYHVFLSSFDRRIIDYNLVSNIIDAMFHGNNPFYSAYGNSEVFPVISMHNVEYYTEDDNGVEVAGFEEQFAEYLVLRLYGNEKRGAINTVFNLVGSEWFDMMDKFYDIVIDRVVERRNSDHVVYQYKK